MAYSELIELYQSSNHSKFRIEFEDKTGPSVVSGLYVSDIGFSVGSNWADGSMSQIESTINEVQKTLSTVGSMIGTNNVQFSSRSMQSSMLYFQGGDKFTINVPFIFLALKRGDDVRLKVTKLLSACLPDFSFEGSEIMTNIRPPLGYHRGEGPGGKVGVEIGQWFSTTRLFVMTDFSYNFTKEVTVDKTPVACAGTIVLKSFRILSSREVQGFLR